MYGHIEARYHTQGLKGGSFLGSILQSLRRKWVIAKKELHLSPWVGSILGDRRGVVLHKNIR